VYKHGGRIFRALAPEAVQQFQALRDSGLLDPLTRRGALIDSTPVSSLPFEAPAAP